MPKSATLTSRFCRDQNVLRLQIAVYDTGTVGAADTCADLSGQFQRLGNRKRAFSMNEGLEVFPLTISMTR
jgi:hypothetical protein